MPANAEVAEPFIEERVLPGYEEQDMLDDGPYVVILYNDDYHTEEEVASQVQKATGYEAARCERIMLEAHTRGRAIALHRFFRRLRASRQHSAPDSPSGGNG